MSVLCLCVQITQACYLLSAVGFTAIYFPPARSPDDVLTSFTSTTTAQPNTSTSSTSSTWRSWSPSIRALDQTFVLMLLARVFAFLFFHPSFNLTDAMAYSVIGENRPAFGKVRGIGSIGFLIIALIGAGIGAIMPHLEALFATPPAATSRFNTFNTTCILSASNQSTCFYSNSNSTSTFDINTTTTTSETQLNQSSPPTQRRVYYLPMVIMCDVLLVCGALSLQCYQLGKVQAHSSLFASIRSVVQNVDLLVMFVYLLLAGALSSTIEAYVWWFVQDLGGSHAIFGLMAVVWCLSEAPVMLCCPYLVERVGHIPSQFVVFAAYTLRFGCYFFLVNPWWILLIDMLHGLTFGLHLLAFTGFVAKVSPRGVQSSMQGLASAMYFGVGDFVGSLLGGFVYGRLGPKTLYAGCSVIALCCTVSYVFVHFVCLRRYHRRKQTLQAQTQQTQQAEAQTQTTHNSIRKGLLKGCHCCYAHTSDQENGHLTETEAALLTDENGIHLNECPVHVNSIELTNGVEMKEIDGNNSAHNGVLINNT